MAESDFVSPFPALLTHCAFVLTLALVIARATTTENIRDAFDAVAGSTGAPRGPGPASSLFLNALCCLPALLVLLRRVVDRQYIVRWTWSHLLFGALALWALLSVLWSTDKFTAIISASHLVAAAALLWSSTQLVRSWLRLRIVAGVCLGLLIVYTAHGLIYRYIDTPENAQFWKENKEQILRERGWEPDSFQAMQFEKKFVGGEIIGFNTSPNSFAAVIALLAIISAGIAIQRYVNRDSILFPLTIALLICPTLWVLHFTHTRTAAGTLTLAALALVSLAHSRLRAFITTHRRAVFFSALACVVLLTIAVIGHGIYHGTLFHDSLNFRWRYWVASASLIKQHPLLGVGWGNFGEHYLAVRLPAAAEEIRDPHNFVVRAFAELGLIGGILVLAWLARAAWELTRPVHPTSPASASATATLIVGTCAIALGATLSMAIGIDWVQIKAYLQLEIFRRVLAMGLLALGVILAIVRSAQRQRQELDDRPAPWLLYAMIIALGAFFVHALMDFVLAEPGPMMLFIVVMGAALGMRMPSAAGQRRHRGVAIGVLTAASLAWLIAIVVLVIPVADAESRAQQADDHLRAGRVKLAAGMLRGAFDTVSSNADYAYRSARAMMMANDPPEQVKAMLAFAIQSDPMNVGYYLTRALLELHQPTPDLDAVWRDYETVLRLDPQNVAVRVDYADALFKHSRPKDAAEQYRKALATNAQYDVKEPKRLPAARVQQIEQAIQQIEQK